MTAFDRAFARKHGWRGRKSKKIRSDEQERKNLMLLLARNQMTALLNRKPRKGD